MLTEHEDAWGVLKHILTKVQNNMKLRKVLAILLVVVLLGVTFYFAYGLLPKNYTLSISGGGMLTNRHHLVRVLQSEAMKSGLNLEIEPLAGSIDILNAVSNGELDIALVQGGLEKKMSDVSHVATLPPEIVHILVKPDIESIADLEGKTINMGKTGGGTRIVAKEILNFFNLNENTDFIEKNYSDEDLLNLHLEELPDAIVSISYIPSYIADYFIKQYGYKLLDIPYSNSLSLRHTWVEECQIPQCTYNVDPSVPEEEITTVGVKLEIIANAHTDPNAISEFLQVLYQSSLENTIKQTLVEETGDSFSEYPLSAGTIAYIHRNEPIFSMEKVDNLKNVFGSAMAGLSTLMVVVKWFKGGHKEEETIPSSDSEKSQESSPPAS